jgi:hypothetical protein
MLDSLRQGLKGSLAREKIIILRKNIDAINHQLSAEQRREIEEIAQVAEMALEIQKAQQQALLRVVPGVDTTHMERLVDSTLREATRALQVTARVNIGVLIFGILLVVASFALAIITARWDAVAFGGLGMAGIIATLVTNPLRSISSGARRVVQVQVAYFSFLGQLSMLSRSTDQVSPIERSKQLGDEMTRTLKALSDHFGK